MTSGAPTAKNAPAALTAEQLQAIGAARLRARPVYRAATVATVSGWTMVGFASLTLLGGLFDFRTFLLGLALSAVAWNELVGGRQLRALSLTAPRRLAIGQLALAGSVCIYAIWGMLASLLGPGPYDAPIAAGGAVAETLEPIDRLTKLVTVAFYGVIMIGTLLMQGGGAWWYETRRKHVRACLEQNPDWTTATLRAAA